MKKIYREGMSIGGETLPMLWELLKLSVAYSELLEFHIGFSDFQEANVLLTYGHRLREFLSPSAFSSPEMSAPVRYGFFGRLKRSFRIKRELSRKKDEFIHVLSVLSEMTEGMTSDPTLFDAFSSALQRLSKGARLGEDVFARAYKISDDVKRELSERGTDISALGLLPIGERIEIQDKKSPYTYPV